MGRCTSLPRCTRLTGHLGGYTTLAGDAKLANHGDSLLKTIKEFLEENKVTLKGSFPMEDPTELGKVCVGVVEKLSLTDRCTIDTAVQQMRVTRSLREITSSLNLGENNTQTQTHTRT